MSKLTERQLLLLKVVGEGTGRPSDWWLDLDQVLTVLHELGWDVSKPSLQFTIRPLCEMGFIERRGLRARDGTKYMRRVLSITDAGRGYLNTAYNLGSVEQALNNVKRWGRTGRQVSRMPCQVMLEGD
jgi:hypothetical protein